MYRLIAEYYEKDNINEFIVGISHDACVWAIADRE